MEPTIENYLEWYKQGLITILPIFVNDSIILISIPIPK